MTRTLASAAIALFVASASIAAAPAGPANPDPRALTAGSYTVEPNHTRVQFTVAHMGFTDWYGDFTHVAGTLQIDPAHVEASKLDISIPVASVSTTNATLDGELKSDQWLDAGQFPTIRFVSTKVVRTGPSSATITGDFTLHGVTKPVTLVASFNGAGVNPLDKAYTAGFNATTTIRRSDYGVKTYVPLIGDETVIRISAAFVRNAS
ncbi:YceI family protein [Sphingomonas sp. PR090111-T3T-6A]|uniref:YceI family protein n=1 Tax=Sphingomonas sp. PR090111-T3T-6A TaxID=685778 RepID=UPI00036D0DD4|nr:YceI family protein [Sphingomonas sp. PR090111-T3T-6A]